MQRVGSEMVNGLALCGAAVACLASADTISPTGVASILQGPEPQRFVPAAPVSYPDKRPGANWRLEAADQGVVLKHGDGPGKCDSQGAREALIFEENGVYHLFYDGAGPNGWLACLATSNDLRVWDKKGPIIDFGKPGELDSAAACSPWVFNDGKEWHMFYLGTPNAGGQDKVPAFPYLFTNHIGLEGGEYTDAIWVYWSKDLHKWNAADKAVVLDGKNCTWSKKCIGMPSVIVVGKRLAIFYDAPGGDSKSHMRRDVGLAWLELPLPPPPSNVK